MRDEQLLSVVRRPSAMPAGALVLLHGRGADETDLAPLLDELDPQRRLVGVTLRAPLQLGPSGHHWYKLGALGHPDPATFLDSYRQVAAWLDELPASTGVPLEATILGGFSQGAVMAYALGLGLGRPSLALLIALSGFVPQAPEFVLDLAGHRDVPVAIGHGSLDQVIPVEFGRAAARQLRDAGLDVDYRESPMPHTIDPAFVGHLARLLTEVLERRLAA